MPVWSDGPLCPSCGQIVELSNSAPGFSPEAECPDCGWSNYQI